MPTNNKKRLLMKLKILRIELQKWAQAKFKGQTSHVAISKWDIQTLDRVEFNAIEISMRIKLKVHIRNLTSILETKWQQ
jgi:hypothetical protein